MWLFCLLGPFIPTQIKFLATPLALLLRECLQISEQSALLAQQRGSVSPTPSLIPRLYDEAGSTSARRALVEPARRASSSSQLVEPASSCKRGIMVTESVLIIGQYSSVIFINRGTKMIKSNLLLSPQLLPAIRQVSGSS